MINRRRFLQNAASGVAGGLLAHFTCAQAISAQRSLKKIGLQLYTVRDEMAKDFEGTLAKVAAIGFDEVEFAGYYNRTPQQVRSILDANRITAPSSHASLRALRDNLGKTIETAQAIGHRFLICPSLPPEERKSLDDYRRLGEEFNRIGEACQKARIQFGYHNHDFEFQAMGGQLPYDVLLKEADPKLVKMELDLYWITKAGQQPITYFDRFPGRFVMFHVKDMDNTPRRFFTEVGRGVIDFKKIFAKSRQAGVVHYFVEQDQSPGSPLDSIKISYDYLRRLKF